MKERGMVFSFHVSVPVEVGEKELGLRSAVWAVVLERVLSGGSWMLVAEPVRVLFGYGSWIYVVEREREIENDKN